MSDANSAYTQVGNPMASEKIAALGQKLKEFESQIAADPGIRDNPNRINEKKVNVWASAPRRRLKEILRQLLAVEVLEYEDKNWLAIDQARRSERKQLELEEALSILERFELDR